MLKLSLEKLWDTLEVKVANETLMLLKGIYILRDFLASSELTKIS